MIRRFFSTSLLVLALGCGLFDSGHPWNDGKYSLLWIDDPDAVTLALDRGRGSWDILVEEQVFAVGSDSRYVVAKQHPGRDRSRTSYWVIDKSVPSGRTPLRPLSKDEFDRLSRSLRLPAFTTTLSSLK